MHRNFGYLLTLIGTTMKRTLPLLMVALMATFANADIIHTTDYEADGAAQGVGFGVAHLPGSMDFSDGGGDFAGQPALGLSDSSASSGSYSYVVDAGQTADNTGGGNWGGNWSGIDSSSGNNSGGFLSQDDAIAAGSGCYIDFQEGTTFKISSMIATDSMNPFTGSGFALGRLEFKDANGTELFRRDQNNGAPTLTSTTMTDQFQLLEFEYTLTAADVASGLIDSVTGVIGVDGLGASTGSGGFVYFDDYTLEVDAGSVVIVGNGHIPEPGSAGLLMIGMLGLGAMRRRKS